MRVRKVGGAGAELDLRGLGDEGRQEDETVGDVLRLVGQVLADKGVVKHQLVGQDDGLAVFLQGGDGVALPGMQRHGEVTKSHGNP